MLGPKSSELDPQTVLKYIEEFDPLELEDLFDFATRLKSRADKIISEHSVQIVKPLITNFFEDNPDVYMVGWSQYTPYFNDGDPCYFSVYDFYYVTAEEVLNSPEILDEHFYEWNMAADKLWVQDESIPPVEKTMAWNNSTYLHYEYKWIEAPPEAKAVWQLSNDLRNTEELLLEAFGDHVQVKITKDSIKVHEYDHD